MRRSADVESAWHSTSCRRSRLATIDRGEFIKQLKRENIATSVHFIPLHIHPYYRNTFQYRPEDFPNALHAYERAISLPLYPRMSDDDVQDVIAAVRRIAGAHQAGRQA